MPPIQLFIAPVRWNQMLLLCHRGRAVTRLKHGRLALHGGKSFMGTSVDAAELQTKHRMS